ncbi:hypothetical protein [Kordia jejudonensis]|uniref:hypothetical protein n=1 Tax=Kordia jejudonensis TaxID=1348245 RepID=UPI00062938E3|nr:hypothetical protein [Kordia jejudonensis]
METDLQVSKKKQLKETVFLILTMVALTAIAIFFLKSHAEDEGKELMKPMNEVSMLHSKQGIKDCINITEKQSQNLIILNSTLQKYKEQHEITFLKLYEYHFTSSTLFLVFSILSALALFLITQEGWKNTAHLVKVSFLVCTAFTSFFGLSLSTFEQKISIDQNANAYIDYDNLQKKLINFCATSLTTEGDSISFGKLHSNIMNEAKNLHGFYLEFDAESVDVANAFSLEKKEKTQPVITKKDTIDNKKDEK